MQPEHFCFLFNMDRYKRLITAILGNERLILAVSLLGSAVFIAKEILVSAPQREAIKTNTPPAQILRSTQRLDQ